MAVKLVIIALCLVVGLTALTQWRAARHERAVEEAYPPSGRFIDVDGHRVHMVEMGEGPPLVLIHGASASTREMTYALAPALAERYRVLVFDRPGLGYSDAVTDQGASLAEQAAILAQATGQIIGDTPPLVLGQSYGGGVALAWGLDHPAAALVLVSGVAMPWTGPLDLQYRVTTSWLGDRLVVPLITAFVPDSHVSRVIGSIFAPQPVPPGYAEHTGPGLILRRESFRANARQRANLLAEIEAQHTRYDTLTLPIEVVHGDADTIVPIGVHAGPFLDKVPQTHLDMISGAGHMPHQTHLRDVIAAIDRAAARAGLR